MHEWIYEWMNEWMNEWTNELINEWMNKWIDEWKNEWMINDYSRRSECECVLCPNQCLPIQLLVIKFT